MNTALLELKNNVCSFSPNEEISDSDWGLFTQNCTVALMAGGEGNRFKPVANGADVNKNSFKLPNDDTMIEMVIRMYRDAGFKEFVALVYHKAETVEQLLGDGSDLGVRITYSYDPEKPVGKGGAVRNAVDNGSIPRGKYLIVHNPDDVVIDYKGNFPRDIVAGHLTGEKKGHIATVVVVEETPYAFSAMKVVDSSVEEIEMYPMIPIPTHMGVTIFSPSVYSYFDMLFDYTVKSDFEKVLFPILSNEKKLYSVSIPENNWIAVNNPKAYTSLLKRLNIK